MSKKLRSKIEALPKKPGIYFFKDKKKEVIYIGKARSLRARVRTYFQSTSDIKIKNIIAETSDIDFILTDSEKEAAFLENNFVRQYQPKFNLRLKDDKSFPYLKVTLQEKFPGIYFTRRVEKDKSKYFGPYSPASQARKTIHLAAKYFGLRTCKENVPGKRRRPCLDYDLKLCSAPCVKYISELDYRENVENALLLMAGKSEKLLKNIKEKMYEASERKKFEQAAHWRDLMYTIEQTKDKPKFISIHPENKDIFGFAREDKNVAIYIFLMRKGKVLESEDIFLLEKKKVSDKDFFSTYMTQFYEEGRDIPDRILLPFTPIQKEEISKRLSMQKGKKIELLIPLRGKNKKLVELANKNAEILLKRKIKGFSALQEMRGILALKTIPKRIEGFDISNIGGTEPVGSLVVFENGSPLKHKYRKYKIKTVVGPNDVASLREVIQRRYTKLLREKKTLPDVILVDGGKGQLSAAKKALKDLGLNQLPVAALAKKEEIIFTTAQKRGIKLERTSPALKLLQNIRDEAHRFALSFHRKRRDKKSFESQLDGIPGLGKKRKAALLSTYKNLEIIKKTPQEELNKIIGPKTTVTLLERLGRKSYS